jgi:hypothetical protein
MCLHYETISKITKPIVKMGILASICILCVRILQFTILYMSIFNYLTYQHIYSYYGREHACVEALARVTLAG